MILLNFSALSNGYYQYRSGERKWRGSEEGVGRGEKRGEGGEREGREEGKVEGRGRGEGRDDSEREGCNEQSCVKD